jgi:hypothetical protein
MNIILRLTTIFLSFAVVATMYAQRAESIWDDAVQAQGGREKLLEISSLAITSSQGKSVSLYVLPNKWWSWEDTRPSPFGVMMRMEDYSTNRNYRGQNGQRNVELTPIVEERLKQSLDDKGNVVWMPGATFLLESRWWRPKILGLRSDTVRGTNVNVVETEQFGIRTDYYLDAKSHLAVKRVNSWKDRDGKDQTSITELFDYVRIDGIMLPSKVIWPGSSVKQTIAVLVNPKYATGIFTAAPAPALEARDAWKIMH